jgi:hypothetical protein
MGRSLFTNDPLSPNVITRVWRSRDRVGFRKQVHGQRRGQLSSPTYEQIANDVFAISALILIVLAVVAGPSATVDVYGLGFPDSVWPNNECAGRDPGLSAAGRLVEEPDPPFRFVDPPLDEACGGEVAEFLRGYASPDGDRRRGVALGADGFAPPRLKGRV